MMRRRTVERVDDLMALGLKMGCLIWLIAGVLLIAGLVHFVAKYW